MVVVTGSTFEILGFFFFPASRESRDSTALGKSLRGELWRPNDQLLSLKPADLFWRAGYGGHDGRLTDVVRPSVPSADAFESSSVREKLSARDVPNPDVHGHSAENDGCRVGLRPK